MPIPKLDFTDEVATVTMMELRRQPGEVMDRVARGLTVYVTKSGRAVAKMVPFTHREDETIIVRPDGSTADGRKPLTFRLDLGGEYSNPTTLQ